MRMSCNGCRVLRKGCSDNCSIRPCVQWIKDPEWQGNATLFLAKFYGRAGLMNLINAAPDNLRPAIFRSLLYEACGRMVNPVYGAVGLLWKGSWELCQEAVEAVLRGQPVMQIPADIRHVGKDINGVSKSSRRPFKRSSRKRTLSPISSTEDAMDSAETVEESLVTRHAEDRGRVLEESEVELELTLGIEPLHHSQSSSSSSSHSPVTEEPREPLGFIRMNNVDGDLGKDLGLDLPTGDEELH
ncbi:LOB domain-containing protein 40-like [Wolffia australiana]